MNTRKNSTNLSIKQIDLSNFQILLKLFTDTSKKTGIPEVLVEKDFWVVTILDWIFNKSIFQKYFVFKGGTSLSKVHKLINRFSEDIDLIVDYKKINPSPENKNVFSTRGMKKLKERQTKDLLSFFKNDFGPKIELYLFKLTGYKWDVSYCIDHYNVQITLSYKSVSSKASVIKRRILIECNCFADTKLSHKHIIQSYVAEQHPLLFNKTNVSVVALDWIRTFWEKVTILHSKANAPDINDEYSRHYYDVYVIANNKICQQQILASIDELIKVANFKNKNYHSAIAQYDLIKDGKLTLTPQKKLVYKKLSNFYQKHREMYFGSKQIKFDEIIDFLKKLEKQINDIILKQK